jgi:hypothetical protein
MSFLKCLGTPAYYGTATLNAAAEDFASATTYAGKRTALNEFNTLANGKEKLVQISMAAFAAPVALAAAGNSIKAIKAGKYKLAAAWGGLFVANTHIASTLCEKISIDKRTLLHSPERDYQYSPGFQVMAVGTWSSVGSVFGYKAVKAYRAAKYAQSFFWGATSVASFGIAALACTLPYSLSKI